MGGWFGLSFLPLSLSHHPPTHPPTHPPQQTTKTSSRVASPSPLSSPNPSKPYGQEVRPTHPPTYLPTTPIYSPTHPPTPTGGLKVLYLSYPEFPKMDPLTLIPPPPPPPPEEAAANPLLPPPPPPLPHDPFTPAETRLVIRGLVVSGGEKYQAIHEYMVGGRTVQVRPTHPPSHPPTHP